MVGSQTAHGDTNDQSNHHCGAAQAGGDRELGGDDVAHVAAALLQAGTEVAMQGVDQVVLVLHQDRLIQAVFCFQRGHSLCADGFFRHEGTARNGLHEEKGEGRHDEQAQKTHGDALDGVFYHLFHSLSSLTFARALRVNARIKIRAELTVSQKQAPPAHSFFTVRLLRTPCCLFDGIWNCAYTDTKYILLYSAKFVNALFQIYAVFL